MKKALIKGNRSVAYKRYNQLLVIWNSYSRTRQQAGFLTCQSTYASIFPVSQ